MLHTERIRWTIIDYVKYRTGDETIENFNKHAPSPQLQTRWGAGVSLKSLPPFTCENLEGKVENLDVFAPSNRLYHGSISSIRQNALYIAPHSQMGRVLFIHTRTNCEKIWLPCLSDSSFHGKFENVPYNVPYHFFQSIYRVKISIGVTSTDYQQWLFTLYSAGPNLVSNK